MVLEVKKQLRETSQSLVRRFGRRVQQSGILMRARHVRFRQRPKSKEAQKRAALRKQELKKKYEQLKKLGKLE
jgi:ribosomal protein S21